MRAPPPRTTSDFSFVEPDEAEQFSLAEQEEIMALEAFRSLFGRVPSHPPHPPQPRLRPKRSELPPVEGVTVSPPSHSTRFDWRRRPAGREGRAGEWRVATWRGGDVVQETEEPVTRPLRVPPRGKKYLQRGEPFHAEVSAYQRRMLPLIEAEKREEERLFRARLEEWPLARLKREGLVLTDLSAFWQGKTFGKHLGVFRHSSPGMTLPSHRFRPGEFVRLSSGDPLNDYVTHPGVVESVSATKLEVSFDIRFNLSASSGWRLDQAPNNVSYGRMRSAVEKLHFDPEPHAKNSNSEREIALQGTHLRDVLLRGYGAAAPDTGLRGVFDDDMLVRSWAKRYASDDPVEVEGDPNLGLNRRQAMAVAHMVGERVSLIQGPPGTGKTATIAKAVELLKSHFSVPHPILLTAYNNVAVDNLVAILHAHTKLRIVRVGNPARVPPELRSTTLVALAEQHPRAEELNKLRIERDAMMRAAMTAVGIQQEGYEAEYRKKRREFQQLRKEIDEAVLRNADVICTTCLGAASSSLRCVDFPVVFVDEASQSTEPGVIIPLMKGCSHVSIIGDHKQLPPVIISDKARYGGLSKSLFERLIQEKNVPSIMLDIQYRMHPALSRFPNDSFYSSALADGTVTSSGDAHPSFTSPASAFLSPASPLSFVDHSFSETRQEESTLNDGETLLVCSVVSDLLARNPELTGDDIGIISPYQAQNNALIRLLQRDVEQRRTFVAELGPQRADEVRKIEVKTVDGFEGREKQVIVFSLTRSNEGGFIGFLEDPRRANVALTRARRGLIVVGNADTLKKGKVGGGSGALSFEKAEKGERRTDLWERFLAHVGQRGGIVTVADTTGAPELPEQRTVAGDEAEVAAVALA